MAQGVVIEKITGKSWEDNIRERILKPLGMNNTNLSVIEMEKSMDRSLAFTVKNDTIVAAIPYRNIDAIAPAGAINSCAKDMANWLITWINNGKFNGKEIIPASFRNQAITVQTATGGGFPGAEHPDIYFSGYGLGWGMNSYRGHYRVEHSGGIDGFITLTSFFPTDSVGIFVVSSQSAVSTIIRNFIADRMLKLSPINWSKEQMDALAKAKAGPKPPNTDSTNRKPGTKPSHSKNEYTGIFENKGYSQAKIFLERDTIWIDYNEAGLRTKSWLQHYHYDVFRVRSTEEEHENFNAQKIRFITGDKGEVVSLETSMEPAVKDIVFEKLPPGIKKSDLEKYAGEYEFTSPVSTAKFYIKNANLFLFIEGQPEYELVAVEKNLFEIKTLKGYTVKFEQNEKGETISCSFIQPNGTFKYIKKK